VTDNPYAPPRAPVRDTNEERRAGSSIGQRFAWGAGLAFVFFGAIILLLPRNQWAAGVLGSGMLALLSGVIAICIPVRSRWIYVTPGIVVCFIIAYLLGSARA
jgi:hypothetical protein